MFRCIGSKSGSIGSIGSKRNGETVVGAYDKVQKKRGMSWMIAAAMVFVLLPMTVNAATINGVTVSGIVPPATGGTPAAQGSVTVTGTGGNVTVTEFKWLQSSTGVFYDPFSGSSFAADMYYILSITVVPATGGDVFTHGTNPMWPSDNNIAVNVGSISGATVGYNNNSTTELTFEIKFPKTTASGGVPQTGLSDLTSARWLTIIFALLSVGLWCYALTRRKTTTTTA